jgi:hypothetical protein
VGDCSVTSEKPCGGGFHREDGCYCIGMRIAPVGPRGEQPWSGVLTVIVHLAAALAPVAESYEAVCESAGDTRPRLTP